MYKAYVFDLDSTVADTIETIAYYVNTTLEKYGLKTFPVEDYKYFVGEGAPLLIERVLKAQDKFEEKLHKEMLDNYLKSYNSKPLYLTSLYEGMEKTLKTLGDRLTALHIHDNNGDNDLHLAPYTQRNWKFDCTTTDWDAFTKALKEIVYEGNLSFETYAALALIPEQLHEPMLKFIAATGKYFREKIEK